MTRRPGLGKQRATATGGSLDGIMSWHTARVEHCETLAGLCMEAECGTDKRVCIDGTLVGGLCQLVEQAP